MTESEAVNDGRARRFGLDAALIAVVATIAAVALAQSWGGWLDPIIDTGRDLYVPEQMRSGARLYRDIIYYYPPLTPYLLLVVTVITGSSLAAYVGIGISIAGLTAAALYWCGRTTGTPIVGFSASALFAACSIAGRSTWGTNYIFPYAHAATLAMLYFVAFIAFLCAFLFGRRAPAHLVAAFAFALAACWTKAEFVVFTAAVIVVAFLAHRLRFVWMAAYAGAGAISIAIVELAFRENPPGRHWLFDNVAPSTLLRSPQLRAFYREVTGLAEWPALTMRSLAGAAGLVVMVALLAAADRRRDRTLRILCFGGAALAAALLLFDDRFFRAWTVLQVALVPFALRRPREPLLILLTASLCATSRVFFNIVPVWYGFVFVVPLYLTISYVFFVWLPQRRILSVTTSRVLVVLIAVICVQALASAHITYGWKEYRVTTSRGSFDDAEEGRAAAIQLFEREAVRLKMRSLVIMPEGLALNYLLRVPTPLAYYTFTPPEAASPVIESRIVADFEARRPEWIAFVPRAVTEYGSRGFGIDYDRRLMAYINAHYAVAEVIRGENFTITLLRRRDHLRNAGS